MKKKYSWRMPSFAKNISASDAVKEIKRIEKSYGDLTPENILDASKNNDALFYSLFTWDDTEAANKYRLQQARTILNNIEIKVISNGEPKMLPLYEVVIKEDNGRVYKNVTTFDENEMEQIKIRTVNEINSLKNKLSIYKQFNDVVTKLDQAAEIAENI